eukprot:c21328_g1_i1 orf=418-897(+)
MAERVTEVDPVTIRDADSASIIEVVGEPAIVVNGVPSLLPVLTVNFPKNAPSQGEEIPLIDAIIPKEDTETGFAMKGRKVKKKFGRQSFMGEVTGFDPSTNWYNVVYEDGDTEDLELEELRKVLLQPGSNPTARKRSYALLDTTNMTLRTRKSRENTEA